MNVALVNPPQQPRLETFSEIGLIVPPLGLAYLAAVLEESDYLVTIIDAPAQGLTFPQLRKELEKLDPDVVGISSTTPNFKEASKVSRLTKAVCPEATVVIGGPHVSFTPEETLRENPSIDVACIGEGECTLLELIKSLEENTDLSEVKGIAYRRNGVVKRNPPQPFIKNLDELPFPARHLLPMNRYRALGKNFVPGTVLTSRGCPFRCIFCSSSLLFGKKFRGRSPENVANELEDLQVEYKIDNIEFLDDLFTFNQKRAEAICQEILDRKLDVRWVCSSRVDTITKKLTMKLKEAGCALIYLGVEAGSQRVLNLIKKGIRIEQSIRALKWAKEVGIETVASFILGVPGETKEEMEQTIKFAKKLNPDYAQFTIATPFPGTELYEKAIEQGLLSENDWSQYTVLRPIVATENFMLRDLEEILRKAYKEFYLRPFYLLRHLIKGRLPLFLKAFRTIALPSLRSRSPAHTRKTARAEYAKP